MLKFILSLLLTCSIFSDTHPTFKIGFIKANIVTNSSKLIKRVTKKLERLDQENKSKWKDKDIKLQSEIQELKKLESSTKHNETKIAKATKDLEQKKQDFEKDISEKEKEMLDLQNSTMEKFKEKVSLASKKIADKHENMIVVPYDFILGFSSNAKNIIDVTDEVIAEINKDEE